MTTIESRHSQRAISKSSHQKLVAAFLDAASKSRKRKESYNLQLQSPRTFRFSDVFESEEFALTSRLSLLELDIFNTSIERRELRESLGILKQRLNQSLTVFQAKQQIFLNARAQFISLTSEISLLENFHNNFQSAYQNESEAAGNRLSLPNQALRFRARKHVSGREVVRRRPFETESSKVS